MLCRVLGPHEADFIDMQTAVPTDKETDRHDIVTHTFYQAYLPQGHSLHDGHNCT